jgi:hypothetical protein
MEPIRVDVQRSDPALEADLKRLRLLAQLFDTQFSVAGIRFGVDALIGLIPVAGDVFSTVVGLYPLLIARRHGLGKVVLARMAANLLIDAAVGAVPVAGDVFDVYFKSFLKNADILERAIAKRRL